VVGVALAVVVMIGVGAVFGVVAAIAVAVLVTFGVGAVFGYAAAIAVAVVAGVAGFAFEIGDMQFCSGPPLGTWADDAAHAVQASRVPRPATPRAGPIAVVVLLLSPSRPPRLLPDSPERVPQHIGLASLSATAVAPRSHEDEGDRTEQDPPR
jgi:hypothetical protein